MQQTLGRTKSSISKTSSIQIKIGEKHVYQVNCIFFLPVFNFLYPLVPFICIVPTTLSLSYLLPIRTDQGCMLACIDMVAAESVKGVVGLVEFVLLPIEVSFTSAAVNVWCACYLIPVNHTPVFYSSYYSGMPLSDWDMYFLYTNQLLLIITSCS